MLLQERNLLSGDPANTTVDQRKLDEKVVGALSGVIVDQVKNAVLPGLPIDVLRIQLGQEGYTGLATTRVEVGKYVAEDIYVSYVHQFGSPHALLRINQNQATVEWRFARRFQLDVTYGDAGVGAANIGFRLRF